MIQPTDLHGTTGAGVRVALIDSGVNAVANGLGSGLSERSGVRSCNHACSLTTAKEDFLLLC